jgi:hypothetical protein
LLFVICYLLLVTCFLLFAFCLCTLSLYLTAKTLTMNFTVCISIFFKPIPLISKTITAVSISGGDISEFPYSICSIANLWFSSGSVCKNKLRRRGEEGGEEKGKRGRERRRDWRIVYRARIMQSWYGIANRSPLFASSVEITLSCVNFIAT